MVDAFKPGTTDEEPTAALIRKIAAGVVDEAMTEIRATVEEAVTDLLTPAQAQIATYALRGAADNIAAEWPDAAARLREFADECVRYVEETSDHA